MKTVIVTDGHYRSAIAAVRMFGDAGYRVIVTQTRAESPYEPASFSSGSAAASVFIEGSCRDEEYPDRLIEVIEKYERPVLFCVGADTLNMVSRQRERFSEVSDFLIAGPDVLDDLNDKEVVHSRAEMLGLPVPHEYRDRPGRYPVVIKPHCGEKAGLKARDRYVIAGDRESFEREMEKMKDVDGDPIVQEKVTGDGAGVNVLMDRESRLAAAYCHRRIREYPMTGGPSTCCVSFYDEKMIEEAYKLLASFNFTGLAMVEFKGGKILEVNPRIWGSFPMAAVCGSPIAEDYARAAAGETVEYEPGNYRKDVKMRFKYNDMAAVLDYLRHGKIGKALGGIVDFFTVSEALKRKDDMAAYRAYLSNSRKEHL